MEKVIEAVAQVMQEVGYVQKTGRNQHQKYNYAGEAHLLAVLRPSMVKHGLVLMPRVTEVRGPDTNGVTTVIVNYDLVHSSGQVLKDAVVMAGQGVDMNREGRVGDKGIYKAITGANKYALLKAFQLETGDDPEAGESPADTDGPGRYEPEPPANPITPDQLAEFELLTVSMAPERVAKGLARYGVTDAADLSAADAEAILGALRGKERA